MSDKDQPRPEYNELYDLARELAQALMDHDIVSPATWLKKRRMALEKAKEFGIEPIPF